jgi:hypothetical protein
VFCDSEVKYPAYPEKLKGDTKEEYIDEFVKGQTQETKVQAGGQSADSKSKKVPNELGKREQTQSLNIPNTFIKFALDSSFGTAINVSQSLYTGILLSTQMLTTSLRVDGHVHCRLRVDPRLGPGVHPRRGGRAILAHADGQLQGLASGEHYQLCARPARVPHVGQPDRQPLLGSILELWVLKKCEKIENPADRLIVIASGTQKI